MTKKEWGAMEQRLPMMHWIFSQIWQEGDARSALNAIELGVLTTEPAEDGKIHIDSGCSTGMYPEKSGEIRQDGDNHYDMISAFIKSMRGSDPDAAVYYLARCLMPEKISRLLQGEL